MCYTSLSNVHFDAIAVNDNLNLRKEVELAKELASKISDFPFGFFFKDNPPTQALFIIEFRKLANRFIEVVRRIEPEQIDQSIPHLLLNVISAVEAHDLYVRLQPAADMIGSIDIDELIRSRSKRREDLRAHLPNIKDEEARAFVGEAITCFEHELYRSAVVMSWLAAVRILYAHVHEHWLKEFNDEAKRIDPKWKPAKTTDDLGRMKERDFLDRIAALSIIGKNVKQELERCLERRNGCGHPNSLKLSQNTAAHHIEVLLMNVIDKL